MASKILVIDDEHTLRQALSDKFTRQGYEVLQAKDGQEGLAMALEHHPEVTIIDILMPVMDGLTLLEKLREDTWGKTAKTIILTNSDEIANVNTALEHGSRDFLMKSETSLESVISTVDNLLKS